MSAGIGHNRGPEMAGVSWRVECWRRARTELLGPRLPVEVVRLRIARARAIGLDYKTYAGVRATTGRDLVAFLFSSNALGIFRPGQTVPQQVAVRIAAMSVGRHLGGAPGVDIVSLGSQIGAVSARPLPVFGTRWSDMRDEMKTWLWQQGLPGDAVLMIGETDHEREMMAAGGLAGFVSGQAFIGAQIAAR